MTPAQFKVLKPQFASVPDVRVQSYLDMAARIVFDPDDQDALAALTCHLMTLDGLGTDASSKSFATGAASYQSIKSGQLTLTRYQKAAGGSSYADWLGQTPCGQFYALLLKMARGGPRIARGGPSRCITAYAKDGWPLWVDNGYPV
jgi:hypothetical protein